jgi:Ribonuclease G/E
MSAPKQETITFKVDSDLASALGNLPNRSEFIRQAILNAMENTCPLCQGTGHLSDHQKIHWKFMVKQHDLQYCETCEAIHEEVSSCPCPATD